MIRDKNPSQLCGPLVSEYAITSWINFKLMYHFLVSLEMTQYFCPDLAVLSSSEIIDFFLFVFCSFQLYFHLTGSPLLQLHTAPKPSNSEILCDLQGKYLEFGVVLYSITAGLLTQ